MKVISRSNFKYHVQKQAKLLKKVLRTDAQTDARTHAQTDIPNYNIRFQKDGDLFFINVRANGNILRVKKITHLLKKSFFTNPVFLSVF